jgi:hypothetical protein
MSVTNLTPIPTRYGGYLFRSRLEAKWAVFFDLLRVKWEYEPEGFVLPGNVHYLPDFRVTGPTGVVAWYEVKPLGSEADPKMLAFSREVENEHHAAQLNGDPVDVFQNLTVCPRCGKIGDHTPDLGWGNLTGIYCGACDQQTPSGGDHPFELSKFGVEYTPHKGYLMVNENALWMHNSETKYLAKQARSARFEHGQSGAV